MIASGTGCCGMIDYVDTRVKSTSVGEIEKGSDTDRPSKLSEWAKTPTPKTHWKSGRELADEPERKRAQHAGVSAYDNDGDGKRSVARSEDRSGSGAWLQWESVLRLWVLRVR